MLRDGIRRIPFLKSFAVLATIAILLELGGIWRELRTIRREQVTATRVDEMFSADGAIPVKVDGSLTDPIYVQADDPLPVEIQH